jgi:hypothetical protein
MKKRNPKIWGTSLPNFQKNAQSRQSPNGPIIRPIWSPSRMSTPFSGIQANVISCPAADLGKWLFVPAGQKNVFQSKKIAHSGGTGLPDGTYIFTPKNPSWGKVRKVLQWKVLVYFMAVWSILRPFGVFCGHVV